MANILKWLKNLWNLNQILSDYADALLKFGPEFYALKQKVDKLENELKETSLFGCTTIFTDRIAEKMAEAKINAEKEEEAPVKEEPKWTVDPNPPSLCEPRVTKRSRYYDPQLNVEYYDFELNGDTVSPDEDTEVE